MGAALVGRRRDERLRRERAGDRHQVEVASRLRPQRTAMKEPAIRAGRRGRGVDVSARHGARPAAAVGGGPERHVEAPEHEPRAVAVPDQEERPHRGGHEHGTRAAGEVDRVDDAAVPLDGDAAPVGRDPRVPVAARRKAERQLRAVAAHRDEALAVEFRRYEEQRPVRRDLEAQASPAHVPTTPGGITVTALPRTAAASGSKARPTPRPRARRAGVRWATRRESWHLRGRPTARRPPPGSPRSARCPAPS